MPNNTAAERSKPPRIAVIGGGITGLAAAHRLIELVPRTRITVFEAADRLGGVLETVRPDGYLVERSADNFLTTRPAGVALCKRLGLADELLPTDETRRRALVVREGRLVPIPADFYLMSPRRLGPMLKSPLLSPIGKLRLLLEPFIPPRAGSMEHVAGNTEQEDAELHAPRRVSSGWLHAPADESVASFACRRLGREVFERLVQPLVAGIYTADSARLSMAATMPQFLMYERQYGSLLRATLNSRQSVGVEVESVSGARYGAFVAPRHGMSSLIATLAARLPSNAVRLQTRIREIRRAADHTWQLEMEPPAAGETFDAVIVAVPSFAAARLLKAHDVQLAAELDSIRYAGCAVVSCAFRRGQIADALDGFGFVVPQIECRRIVAGSFASHKFTGRAPHDSVLVRTFVGGSLQPELAELPDDDLRRLVLDELGDLLRITGTPQFTDIARWPQSMPQYHVGHLARVARIEQKSARWPTLALAGNAYHGVGIPQCIASGEAAAERVAVRSR